MKIRIAIAILILLWIVLWSCSSSQRGVRVAAEPYKTLAEYGFFIGPIADMNPADGVLPYDLSNPLYSDYAYKARYVWMPEGSTARYSDEGILDFPEDAILIKSFYYQHDERDHTAGRRIIETRLLINNGEQWEARSYVWNEEQTEAVYDVIGEITPVSWINSYGQQMNVDYIIPNKNQCKGCHYYDGKQLPIGPKVGNLNKTYAYHDGEMNQLDKWEEVGYLKGIPTDTPPHQWAAWDDPNSGNLHSRAMAYLDINCRHCHNPKGPANTTGLTLRADAPPDGQIGIYKSSVAAGAGTGGNEYNIVPGHPEQSILYYRMVSTDPAAMMPELGRRTAHIEGLALIKEWIEKME